MKVEKIIQTTETTEIEITGATLLSIGEVKKLPTELRKYDHWWWLQSPGDDQFVTTLVHFDGSICSSGVCVNYSDVMVRPTLRIKNLRSSNLKIGDTFKFGGIEFEIISNDFAFCKSDIGCHYFREDWKSDDANDYEKSDIKKFVDDWFGVAKTK